MIAKVNALLSKYPPQARGWTPKIPRRNGKRFVSPAGAGMDLVVRERA